jgi:Spy/CpxP family protein refolding chaperone
LRTLTFSKRPTVLVAVAVLMLAVVLTAWAQPDQPPRDGDRPMRERIETVIIGKFSSDLNLTPEQAEKFFPRFRQFQTQAEDWHKAQKDRREQMEAISQDPKAGKSKVTELLNQDAQSQQQMLEMKKQFLSDVSAFLSAQQVSRCAILMDDLPRRVHQLIEEHREGGHHGRGPDDDRPGHQRRGY